MFPQAEAGAAGEKQSFHAEYAVSYLGLTIARSRFDSTISRSAFEIGGSLKSAGLAEMFDDTKGTTSTSGSFTAKSTRPVSFAADYVTGKKKKKIAMSFAGDAITQSVYLPEPGPRAADWLAVQPAHLKGVTDPLSATLVQASSPAEVCQRTLKIFDGEMRADLILAPAGTEKLSLRGYKGEAVVCTARFSPVSGYRKGHRSIAYLKNRAKIRIAFAPMGTTGIYAPVHATVSTLIGTITIGAVKIEPR
ncbi:DUF3108 domain-containing protein [Mesorhizobium sp. NBSH29]|uniref:DUF3108 domain-containing protein n=1 Tax=Mesorhizobium sp. NBSH29 TaxID=2654249 RepID=UPI0021566A4B|nr:DUF3108 domain-containing protein [Mesorhizobium sp. NBSH29]